MVRIEIDYVGMKDLKQEEQESVRRVIEEGAPKLERHAQNAAMTVHIKREQKGEGRHIFSLHVRLRMPSKTIFESCHSHGYDLVTALHESIDDLEHQLERRMRK